MILMNDILKAYNDGRSLVSDGVSLSVLCEKAPDADNINFLKIKNSLSEISKYWYNEIKHIDCIYFLYSDENSLPWLEQKMKKLNFYDAFPTQERISQIKIQGTTGGGGISWVNEKLNLIFWQIVNSKSEIKNTGEIKTAPHLYSHSVQSYLANINGYKSTNFPAWFIEGQSDFSSLVSISNTSKEYIQNRINFFKTAYIPGEQTRNEIKLWKTNDWAKNLKSSPMPFDGIPLIYEYYTGLLLYEKMMSKIGHFEIMNIFYETCKNSNFYNNFTEKMNIKIEDFYLDCAQELAELSKNIGF